MLIDFNSEWFQSYCRARLEDDPEIAGIYIEDALAAINQARTTPPAGDGERQAMDAAIRYLRLRKEVELRRAG